MEKEDNIRFVGGHIPSAEHSLLTLYCAVYKVSKARVIQKSVNQLISHTTVEDLTERLIDRYQDRWNAEKKSHELSGEYTSHQFAYFKNRIVMELEMMRLEKDVINQIKDRLRE